MEGAAGWLANRFEPCGTRKDRSSILPPSSWTTDGNWQTSLAQNQRSLGSTPRSPTWLTGVKETPLPSKQMLRVRFPGEPRLASLGKLANPTGLDPVVERHSRFDSGGRYCEVAALRTSGCEPDRRGWIPRFTPGSVVLQGARRIVDPVGRVRFSSEPHEC